MWQPITRDHNGNTHSRHLRWLPWVIPAFLALLLFGGAGATPAVAAQLFPSIGGPYTGVAGQPITINATVTPISNCTINNYIWNFSDGFNPGNTSVATHAFATNGTFNISLFVSDTCANSGSVTTAATIGSGSSTTGCTANVNNPLVVSITPPAQSTSVGTPISFFGTATGGTGTVNYNWAFGDGTTGSGISVQHAFTTAGTFTVILNVNDQLGRTGCATSTITVAGSGTSGTSTNANIRVAPNGPYTGNVGQSISFGGFASSSNQVNGQNATITGYQWTFGDNTSATGQFVSHTYTTAGTFTVTLTATDSSGQSGSATTTATIGGGSSGSGGTNTGTGSVTANGVTANTGGPYTGSSGTAITFNGTATTSNAGATIASCVWSFGDSSTSAPCQGATHTYNSNGTYTAVVTVTDSTGAVAAASTTVTISGGNRVVNLVAGCNNVVATFPDGTPTSTLANGVNAQSALLSVWKLSDPTSGKYLGFFPNASAASDLTSLKRLDAIFICVNSTATLTEPSA